MSEPNGCVRNGGAFNSGFSEGFSIGGLVCGPYYRDAQDLITPGVQAADLPPAIVAGQVFTYVVAEDERE